MITNNQDALFLYSYICHEEEESLCRMELRALFKAYPEARYILNQRGIDPSRSAFLKQRIEVWIRSDSLQKIEQFAAEIDLTGQTFKVIYVDTERAEINYEQKRSIEKRIGFKLRGKAEMRKPELQFGICCIKGVWMFGPLVEQEAIWLKHQKKPHNYSMALNTRTARALVNIAAPDPLDVQMIDPCCGIGTVLIEALSMGISILGYDINPLAVVGARKNLQHFGYPDVVKIKDIADVMQCFDTLVLDMPYNLYSKISREEQKALLVHARRLTKKAVIVSMEPIETVLRETGFSLTDQCELRKGRFTRNVYLCQ
jgi:tRNA G10  N-methylase Trm11